MEYYLLTQTDFNSFVEEANKLLRDGWSLQGGASVSISETEHFKITLYAQAFVRKIAAGAKLDTALHR